MPLPPPAKSFTAVWESYLTGAKYVQSCNYHSVDYVRLCVYSQILVEMCKVHKMDYSEKMLELVALDRSSGFSKCPEKLQNILCGVQIFNEAAFVNLIMNHERLSL